MKSLLSLSILCVPLLTCIATHGAEALVMPEEASCVPDEEVSYHCLQITNYLQDKVELVFRYEGTDARISQTLIPTQELDIHFLEDLVELYVLPYGKIKGHLSLSSLSLGSYSGVNLMQRDDVRAAKKLQEHHALTINEALIPTEDPKDSGVMSTFKSFLSRTILPYRVEVKAYVERSFIPRGSILTWFPQVYKAYYEDQTIHPRYFFNLSEYASQDSLNTAYQFTSQAFLRCMKSSKGSKRDLGASILVLLDEAYKMLKGEKNRYLLTLREQGYNERWYGVNHHSATDSEDTSLEVGGQTGWVSNDEDSE